MILTAHSSTDRTRFSPSQASRIPLSLALPQYTQRGEWELLSFYLTPLGLTHSYTDGLFNILVEKGERRFLLLFKVEIVSRIELVLKASDRRGVSGFFFFLPMIEGGNWLRNNEHAFPVHRLLIAHSHFRDDTSFTIINMPFGAQTFNEGQNFYNAV